MKSIKLSDVNLQNLRDEAHATHRYYQAVADSVLKAVADLDEAILLSRDTRSIDEFESLRSAAERLTERLESTVTQ